MSDLIDREAVREFIKSYRHSTDVAFHMEDHLDEIPAASLLHRTEEPPREDGWYILCFLSRWRDGNWWIPNFPDYWMPPMPPKEE